MRINKDYVVRRVAGETMLIPVGKSVIEHNGIFTLSESGAFIYDRLCEGKTRDEIVEDRVRRRRSDDKKRRR